jgi:hypothetical protein
MKQYDFFIIHGGQRCVDVLGRRVKANVNVKDAQPSG